VFTPIAMEMPPPLNEPLVTDIGPIWVETNGVVELLQSLEAYKTAGPDSTPIERV